MSVFKIKALAVKLALGAGKIQRAKWGKRLDIRWKQATDPVTEVDHASEVLIVKGITRAFPSHAILGEEGGVQGAAAKDAEYSWVVDPLDGTVNYSHALPNFCVSIGVLRRGKPVVGVVHAPALGELYVAVKGEGATLNGRPIRVSKQKEPLHALLASGFAYTARDNGENLREWVDVMRSFQAMRRFGSAALDLSWVACGRFDAFWEYGLKPWDTAAASLIVQEAGGLVSGLDGKPHQPGTMIVASNRPLYQPLLRVLRRAQKRKLVWPPR